MKKISLSIAMIFAFAAMISAQTIQPDSSRVVVHAYHGDGSEVRGIIKGMQGKVTFDPENPGEGHFQVCIDPSTILTGNGMRNFHIRGRHYLGVRKYPEICFTSKEIRSVTKGYEAVGDLSIKGVTREIVIPFTYEQGVLEGRIELNRYDYDVGNTNEERVAPLMQADIRCVLVQ